MFTSWGENLLLFPAVSIILLVIRFHSFMLPAQCDLSNWWRQPLKTKIHLYYSVKPQSVPRSKHSSVIKTNQLLLCREIIAVRSQIHTNHINTLCGQNVELYIKIQSVPRSKHSVSVIKASQLMLYREIIAVCSQIHTKHINTLWAERRISEC
jgi:hypothetical protein